MCSITSKRICNSTCNVCNVCKVNDYKTAAIVHEKTNLAAYLK